MIHILNNVAPDHPEKLAFHYPSTRTRGRLPPIEPLRLVHRLRFEEMVPR